MFSVLNASYGLFKLPFIDVVVIVIKFFEDILHEALQVLFFCPLYVEAQVM